MFEALGRYQERALGLLRIFAGFAFFPHGAQKLFGWFDGRTADLFSVLGLAGVLEFFGGLAILLGLFTRPVAFVLAGEMAVAFLWRHLPRAFWPILNRGELAVLYCFIFLYLATAGPGRWSLDGLLRRSEAGRVAGSSAP
jgi:putative oxidoreductase